MVVLEAGGKKESRTGFLRGDDGTVFQIKGEASSLIESAPILRVFERTGEGKERAIESASEGAWE